MENNDKRNDVSPKEVKPMSTLTKVYWGWVLGSFAALIICALIKSLNIAVTPILGQLMLGLGIIFLVNTKKKYFKTVCFYLLFIISGLALLVASFVQIVFPNYEPPKGAFVFLFPVIGVLMMIWPVISYLIDKKHCTEEVDATCIDLVENPSRTNNRRTYTPVYRYTYGGKEYEVRNSSYTNYALPTIGEELTLFINPDDPEYFFDKKRSAKSGVGIAIIGAFFVAVGTIALLVIFNVL